MKNNSADQIKHLYVSVLQLHVRTCKLENGNFSKNNSFLRSLPQPCSTFLFKTVSLCTRSVLLIVKKIINFFNTRSRLESLITGMGNIWYAEIICQVNRISTFIGFDCWNKNNHHQSLISQQILMNSKPPFVAKIFDCSLKEKCFVVIFKCCLFCRKVSFHVSHSYPDLNFPM